jgi:glycosyltransferase involved in cell wall biosynthesis
MLNKPKRKCIWIINQYVGSPTHGMEYRHFYLAKEFIKKGFDVTIISGSYSHLYKSLPVIDGHFTFEIIDDIKYCWVKVPTYTSSISLGRFWNMFVFMLKLFFIPLKKCQPPHSIIISSPSLFPIINAKWLAHKYKSLLIFEVRDIWPMTIQALGKLSAYHPLVLLLSLFEKFGYRNSNFVCSVLPGAKQHMVSIGLQPSRFFYAPNGILLEEVEHPQPLSEEIKKVIPIDKFIIGYVGTMGVSNALTYLMNAVQLLQHETSIFFVLIGDGGEKAALKKMTDGLNNILFVESIPKQQVQSAIQLFDACYIGWNDEPLYKYGISANKLYDYMYSGKPIIHSFSSDNDPVAIARCGISCRAESPEQIKESILQMASLSTSARDEMGMNGKSYVLQNHSYDAIANQFIKVMQ